MNERNVTISTHDKSIGALVFYSNTNIFYLPVGVDQSFPNLLGYEAEHCAIKIISRQNFKRLKKLKFLFLAHNQIEKISSNTFNDLKYLTRLDLSENFSIFHFAVY